MCTTHPWDLLDGKDHDLPPVKSVFLRLGCDEFLASTFVFGKRKKEGIILERGNLRKGQILKGKDFGILEGVKVSERHFCDLAVLPQALLTYTVPKKISCASPAWVAGSELGR